MIRTGPLALAAWLLGFASGALALDPQRPLAELGVDGWNYRDGLPHAYMTDVAQARDGHIWVSSWLGAARFNGREFTLFDDRNTPQLGDKGVLALAAARDGAVWLATASAGVAIHREGRWSKLGLAEGLPSLNIVSLLEDRAGRWWIGTADRGVVRLDHGKARVFGTADGLPDSAVLALTEGPDASIWLSTPSGLARIDGEGVRAYGVESGLPPSELRAVLAQRDGRVRVGTSAGIYAFANERFIRDRDLSLDIDVNRLLEDRDGAVWIAANAGGLYRATSHGVEHIASDNGLPSDYVDALLEDREGSIWAGTHGGLARLGQTRFAHYTKLKGLADDFVRAVAEDEHGVVWVATNHGLSRLQGGVIKNYFEADGLPGNGLLSLLPRGGGELWVGTYSKGVTAFDGRSFGRPFAAGTSTGSNVRALLEGRDGALWVGTATGLTRILRGQTTAWTHVGDQSRIYVRSLHETRDGTLYVGMQQGLARLRGDTLEQVPGVTERAGPVFSIRECAHGALWLGVRTGLARLREGKLTLLGAAQGLDGNTIFAILEDRAGRDWMSTSEGILRVSHDALEAVADGAAPNVVVDVIGAPGSGEPINANGGSQPAALAARDGRLWFATSHGAIAIDPDAPVAAAEPPPIAIEGLWVDGAEWNADAGQLLPPGTRRVEARYAGLSYLQPGALRYRYRMVGFDEDWIDAGSRLVAAYTNLPPGTFRFEVAVSATGVQGPWNQAAREVSIEPRLYQRSAFRFVALAALVLVAALGYRARTRVLRRDALRLQDEVDARTQEISLKTERLAAADQEKAGLIQRLEQNQSNLSVLGEIGREITATLDQDAVVQTLDRHVHALLDAALFAIYLLDVDGGSLGSIVFVEEGQPRAPDRVELDNPTRACARCVRERREILVDVAPGTEDPAAQAPGTLPTLSRLFAPLAIGERVFGLMTIQSPHRNAYAEREQMIFRTLCAYGAIALDNAAAYRRLAETDAALQRTLGEQRSALQQIEQTHQQVSLLSELIGFLQACPSEAEAYACIAEYGPRLYPGSLGVLYLLEETGTVLVEKAFWSGATTEDTRARRITLHDCWALRRGQPYRVDHPASALCCPHVAAMSGERQPSSCVPLMAQGKTLGLLFVEHRRLSDGMALDVPQGLVVAMAEQAGLALANVRLREALLQQSIRDPLTGLYNRRHMHEVLKRELTRCRHKNAVLSALMIDVDHFKKFNDTFGHHAGDVVLQGVARLIDARFRDVDVACRFGGEEFVVLLPGCALERAKERALELLDAVRALRLTHENRVLGAVTASLGLAQFPLHGDTPVALIAAADAALYQAKLDGRDRIVVAQERSVEV